MSIVWWTNSSGRLYDSECTGPLSHKDPLPLCGMVDKYWQGLTISFEDVHLPLTRMYSLHVCIWISWPTNNQGHMRLDLSLNSHPKDWWRRSLNQWPLFIRQVTYPLYYSCFSHYMYIWNYSSGGFACVCPKLQFWRLYMPLSPIINNFASDCNERFQAFKKIEQWKTSNIPKIYIWPAWQENLVLWPVKKQISLGICSI